MVIPSQIFILMHLIYKINFPSKKVYIGQTNNLKKRMTDHLKEARNGNNSKVYRAFRKYQTTRADFEIIEQGIETQEQADEREIYWIAYYNSFKNGYNSTPGGDVGNGGMLKGENSYNAAFTNEEVKKIRLIRATLKYTKSEVYEMYKDRISEGGFHKIWNYETYTEVAPELNTPEIAKFYRHNRVSGSKSKCNKFNKDQVKEIRNKYYIDAITSYDLAKEYNVGPGCIQRLVAGKTYSDIPLPEPSLKFRRKKHIFTEEEIEQLVQNFIKSNLNIKDYLNLISQDDENVFGGFSYTSFRQFILKQLEIRNLEYKTNGKWNFKIICKS